MGPGRSSSLRIGGDSLAVASSGRTGGASDRSAGVELRDTPGAPPFPLDKGKGKVDLIKYHGGSEYLKSAVQHALPVGLSDECKTHLCFEFISHAILCIWYPYSCETHKISSKPGFVGLLMKSK